MMIQNDGEHLVIGGGAYDLWPSTGRWRAWGDKRSYFGVERLIKRIGVERLIKRIQRP